MFQCVSNDADRRYLVWQYILLEENPGHSEPAFRTVNKTNRRHVISCKKQFVTVDAAIKWLSSSYKGFITMS